MSPMSAPKFRTAPIVPRTGGHRCQGGRPWALTSCPPAVRMGVSVEGISVAGRRVLKSRTLRAERLNACEVTEETESRHRRMF